MITQFYKHVCYYTIFASLCRLSYGAQFGGELTIDQEYQSTGWTGIYTFTPDRPVMGGTCTVTLQSPVKWFDVKTEGLIMYVRADYPIPSNEFKLVFDRVSNVPGIYPVSKAQITMTYFDNAKFSVSGIRIVCDDTDKYRYAMRSFPFNSGQDLFIQSSFIDAQSGWPGGSAYPGDKAYTVHLGSKVSRFQVYDSNLQDFTNVGMQNFTMKNIPNYAAEVLIEWDEIESFQSNQVLINYGGDPVPTDFYPTDPVTNPKTDPVTNPVTDPSTNPNTAETSTTIYYPPRPPGREPSCAHKKSGDFNWYRCALDQEADTWYGISNTPMTWASARQSCVFMSDDEINGLPLSQLVAVNEEYIDKCMYDIYHNVFTSNQPLDYDLEILYSGHQPDASISDEFYWVKTNSNGDIDSDIAPVNDYQRWMYDYENVNNSCIAGKIPAGERTFEKYGWTAVDCTKKYRFMCRMNCAEVNPTPPPPVPTSAWRGGYFYILVVALVLIN